jgi:hypothetical protein
MLPLKIREQASKMFIESLRQLVASSDGDQNESNEDERYTAIREEAVQILNLYAQDPLNTALIKRCDDLVLRLKSLDTEAMEDKNRQRSMANVIAISATSKRTHYAAYMTGRWSTDKRLEKPYKAWMHNAAADGAISLYDYIRQTTDPLVSQPDDPSDDRHESAHMLRIFGDGACCDANRFLQMADEFYPNCVITRYNKAKINILSAADSDDVRLGIEQLLSIQPCAPSCLPAEFGWHRNLRDSFTGDQTMREVIINYEPNMVGEIQRKLTDNARRADELEQERAETNQPAPQSSVSKAVVTATASGIVLVTYLVLSHVPMNDVVSLLLSHWNVLDAHTSHITEAPKAAAGILQSAAEGLQVATGGLMQVATGGLMQSATGGLMQTATGGLSSVDAVKCIFSATGGL